MKKECGGTNQVVTEELHNQGRILVRLLREGIELYKINQSRSNNELKKHTSNSIIESLLGQLASLIGRVEDLVIEDREVKGESETDRMRGGEVSLGNFGGVLVGLEGLVGGLLALVTESELGEVAVVITLPVAEVRSIPFKTIGGNLTSCGRRP